MTLTVQETQESVLDVAQELIAYGVPVFVAKRNPKYDTGKNLPEFHLPQKWQDTKPTAGAVAAWRPGDALCLVAGHGLDVVDVDTKNGAKVDEQLERLKGCGVTVLATVETPSGGAHFYVHSVGVCSSALPSIGVDFRGLGLDKSGAGFVYLPGTSRPKYAGKGYQWVQGLDPEDIHDVRPAVVEEQADAVSVYLAGLGINVRTRKDPEGVTVKGEPVDFLPEGLRRDLATAGPWPKSDGTMSTDRSGRFMHLVGACRRAGLTQGQAVTAVAPWCSLTGKYVGRVPEEVARVWEKVKPTDQAVGEWLQDVEAPEGPSGLGVQDPPESPSSWSPVDLGPYLDGSHVQELAELFPRSDGQGLLYAGRLHSFHGESESGKSLLAQAEAARVLGLGGRVLYVDFESDPSTVTGRLLSLGATQAEIGAGLDYLMPEEGLSTGRALIAFNAVLERSYVLAVLDGVTEALNLVAASGGKPEEQIAQYVRVLPRRIARRTGAAVLQVDHVTKSTEGRGRFALGSQHKMNTLDGAAYLVEVEAPLGPDLRGVVVLRVGKDRPGNIRGNSGRYRQADRTQEAARVILDGTQQAGRTFVTVEPPSSRIGHDDEDRPFRPTGLMEKVSRRLEMSPEPLSQKDATLDLGKKAEHARAALALLISEGYVTKETGPRGAHLHTSERAYRQAEDPESDNYSQRDNLTE